MNSPTGQLDASAIFGSRSDGEWLELLRRSVSEEVIDGVRFPRFPADALQSQFVGSSNISALNEANQFYVELKNQAENAGTPVGPDSSVLDLGCGWGRFLRFFWKDVKPSGLHGADVDPDVLSVCEKTGVPGQFTRIYPKTPLPYADRSFSHVMAYSVFTHLPQDVHLHVAKEVARILKPGGIFALTLEPRRFLDFVLSLKDTDRKTSWHQTMAKFAESVPEFKRTFDAGKFVYLPTGGGAYRDASTYGDAVVPLSFIEENWTQDFRIVDYIDDPARFWQAALIVRRL